MVLIPSSPAPGPPDRHMTGVSPHTGKPDPGILPCHPTPPWVLDSPAPSSSASSGDSSSSTAEVGARSGMAGVSRPGTSQLRDRQCQRLITQVQWPRRGGNDITTAPSPGTRRGGQLWGASGTSIIHGNPDSTTHPSGLWLRSQGGGREGGRVSPDTSFLGSSLIWKVEPSEPAFSEVHLQLLHLCISCRLHHPPAVRCWDRCLKKRSDILVTTHSRALG